MDCLIDVYKKHREIIMYIICGVATTLVSMLTYYLLTTLVFDANNALQLQITNVISWVISVLFAYVTNKIFVFQSKASPFLEILKFYGARFGTYLIDAILMHLLVIVCSVNDLLSKGVVQIIVIVLNYVFGKIVFKKE